MGVSGFITVRCIAATMAAGTAYEPIIIIITMAVKFCFKRLTPGTCKGPGTTQNPGSQPYSEKICKSKWPKATFATSHYSISFPI